MDIDMNDILREIVAFLESLRDAQLSCRLENLREKLLIRSKNILSVTTTTRSSPEPYLDMNSGLKRPPLLLTKNEADAEEYVKVEECPKQLHQDYYEAFGYEDQSIAMIDQPEQNNDQNDSKIMIEIYKNLSAAQSKGRCHKCGPLYKKEEKKLFLSESRACWIALVGSHLLVYRSDRHNRPYAIYSIRGYMARPAPNLLPRDRQKSELTFEMCCPGNETLQFIARTPKDMDQWIAKICEVACSNENIKYGKFHDKRLTIISDKSPINLRKDNEEYHQNAEKLAIVNKPMAKIESKINDNEVMRKSPPPLPARIPRRLPSLPPNNSLSTKSTSYKVIIENDDDDDIYHKIEDLKNGTAYQNMILSKKQSTNISNMKHEAVAAYDATCMSKEGKEGRVQGEKSIPFEEMYDDIVTLSHINTITNTEEENRDDYPITNGNEGREESYDDIENLTPNVKFIKDRAKNQVETSKKFLQRKSFLDRVWNRREFPSKSDKKFKGKISLIPSASATTEEISTYDDISLSDLMSNQEFLVDKEEESPEYNCPPPPRPVYTKSPIVNNINQIEEFYDDIGTYRQQYIKNHQIIMQLPHEICTKAKRIKNIATDLETNNDLSREIEIEHYQSPRSDLCIHNIMKTEDQQNEELYDDIALLTDFRARQKDITEKKSSNENDKSMIDSDKKSRNLFTVNKKSQLSNHEHICFTETNKRSDNETEEIDDFTDNNVGQLREKKNTFQKLISKMENSLAKVSARSPPSLPTSKPNTASNNA